MPIRERQKWFLREWRKHRGLTQEKLAERLDTTKSRISELENGRERYNQDVLEMLAEALECDPADLLMRNPLDPEAVWSLWDRIPAPQRGQALKVMETFAEPFKPDQNGAPPPKRRKKTG